MKEWLLAIFTQNNKYEVYVDSSKVEPFGILRNNEPLPKRYSTVWNTIQAMEYLSRHETIIKYYIGTIDTIEDVHPQTHEYFIRHYSTGKHRP